MDLHRLLLGDIRSLPHRYFSGHLIRHAVTSAADRDNLNKKPNLTDYFNSTAVRKSPHFHVPGGVLCIMNWRCEFFCVNNARSHAAKAPQHSQRYAEVVEDLGQFSVANTPSNYLIFFLTRFVVGISCQNLSTASVLRAWGAKPTGGQKWINSVQFVGFSCLLWSVFCGFLLLIVSWNAVKNSGFIEMIFNR
jgi:hypothetical protein